MKLLCDWQRVQKEIFSACEEGDLAAVLEAFENGAGLDVKDEVRGLFCSISLNLLVSYIGLGTPLLLI